MEFIKYIIPILLVCTFTANSQTFGPLKVDPNHRWFLDSRGKAVALFGSHTWDDFQDTDTTAFPARFDFDSYVDFLKSHGMNVTILWKKDLPTYCAWKGTGTWTMTPFPWKRTVNRGRASDGKGKFDLTKFDQSYFARLRNRVIRLQENGIYAIVQLFDGLGLAANRCWTDGYPFTGGNNLNGIDDGGGADSMNLSYAKAHQILVYQDAYVKKVIDTLNDLDNVLWQVSEEAPLNSASWNAHMINLIHSYEGTPRNPVRHPVGFPTLNISAPNDDLLYASAAEWVAPFARFAPSNTGKVIVNDSDHSYYGIWNDTAQVNRNYLWENFMNGSMVLFMDPYLIYINDADEVNRNLCSPANPPNGVCSAVDPRWENLRLNLGYAVAYANRMNNLEAMTPQTTPGFPSSTGYCLYSVTEYLVYAPNGGTFTLDLSLTDGSLQTEWFDPNTGAIQTGTVNGGGVRSLTSPYGSDDAVLYVY